MQVEYTGDIRVTNPKRGYYSEVIANRPTRERAREPPGAPKRLKLTWQAKTERFTPVIHRLIGPLRTRFLAPEERWITYDAAGRQVAFPFESFKPKVQMEHVVMPFCLPRTVEIERRRREYGSHRISTLLSDLKIDSETLIPPEVLEDLVESDTRFDLFCGLNFLPLELFDNEEFDCRLPLEWLDMGISDNVHHPVPGEAFVPVHSILVNESPSISDSSISLSTIDEPEVDVSELYAWTPVAVTGYDPDTKLYQVATLDSYEERHYVPRLFLMFKAEDPQNFALRIADAVDRRNYVEGTIKYQLYVDCMMFPGLENIKESSLQRIFKMATRDGTMKIPADRFDKLEKEIHMSYKRTQCDLSFRYVFETYLSFYPFITVPKSVCEWDAVTEQGCIASPMADFRGTREHLRWSHLFVIPESYEAISFLVVQCMKASAMSLFTTNYGKYVSLEEFEAAQIQCTNNVMTFLHNIWLENIAQETRMCLRDVGKGWFNILEHKWSIYEISKLSRMMCLIKFRMEGALRNMVNNSIQIYVKLLETPCLCTLECPEDFEWGEDVITTQFNPASNPIFMLFIKMDEEKVFYSTDPFQFEKTIISLYDNGIILTHGVRQVHPSILEKLKFAEDLKLSSVGLKEKEVCENRERLERAYRQSIIPLIAYSKEYIVHIDLWKLNVENYVSNFSSENHTPNEVREEVAIQYRMKHNLEVLLPETIFIGPFVVNVGPLKQVLVNKRQELATKLLDMFAAYMRKQVDEVLDEYKIVMRKLGEKPTSIEHIFEIRDWMETIVMTVRAQEEITKRLVLEYEILDHFWYALEQEDFECKWMAIGWPLRIANQVEATNQFLEEEVAKFTAIQINDELTLQEKVDNFTVQVTAMSLFSDMTKTHEIAVDIRKLWKQMKDAQENGQLLNQRQRLFGMPVVPFDNLNKLIKEFEPYRNLWITASDWMRSYDMWMDNPLVNIDGEAIERTVTEFYRTAVKSVRVFVEVPAVQNVAQEVRTQIEEFRPHIPLIQALRNPGMRQRHWDQLEEETGIKLVWSPILTYNMCREEGIESEVERLTAIAESASKEYSIEQTMDKMEREWDAIFMDVSPYKQSGTYIMKISDEISQMLDDHIVMTQAISFSPFKAAFEKKINEWEDKLRLTQEVMDEWMECQKQWMYLEPIFTSEDINRQLPIEAKKYNSMERTWRRVMKAAFEQPKVMMICPDKQLLESLKECNHLLEQVQKGLAEYLETKRSVFPRFYFLSDDELLEILSQAKNPTAVQPHLRKCFENVAKLNFQPDLEITAMFSAEGESVSLIPSMYPRGNVEDWLLKVEAAMRNTIRMTLGESLDDLNVKERTQWVLSWPGQIVIAGCQTYWTAHVEQGLRENKLREYYNTMLDQLDGLRGLVKGPLKRVERQVLSALIVIEVHARDVLHTLVLENVKNINDFDWISQLRYYWVEEEELKVRAVNAEFQYGYEYLGNSGRLVITPLTDRCYLTLTGALHLKFGGAPAGPAGTGKTETTKDLAKAFAIQCVVFNCSDQLDFMAMGKFFKGLAASGAWACFDEFNRIDIEVLSVVAQQITTIQKAQQARCERFMFEGVEIALKESCAVFITMNPGYAGRTELPDNLKALFRPVAMMVPNYALIAEISLFSFGFGDAKELAGKITTTFKLSSEQLSTQDHYDFGMRAVKTVIAVAGNLKRENPDMDERQIVLRSLRDVNVPKFLKDDLKLFNGIVSDLFPRMIEQVVDHGELEKSIRKTLIKFGLEDVDGIAFIALPGWILLSSSTILMFFGRHN